MQRVFMEWEMRIALSVILADKFVSIYEVSIMHLMLQARMVRVSHVRGR